MPVRLQEYGSALGRAISRLFQMSGVPVFQLGGTISPVLDVADMLYEPAILNSVQSITGNGNVVFCTVPKGERWRLKDYDLVVATGTYTLSSLFLQSPGTEYITIDATAGQRLISDMAEQPVIETGWSVVAVISGHSVNGNTQLELLFDKQKIVG